MKSQRRQLPTYHPRWPQLCTHNLHFSTIEPYPNIVGLRKEALQSIWDKKNSQNWTLAHNIHLLVCEIYIMGVQSSTDQPRVQVVPHNLILSSSIHFFRLDSSSSCCNLSLNGRKVTSESWPFHPQFSSIDEAYSSLPSYVHSNWFSSNSIDNIIKLPRRFNLL